MGLGFKKFVEYMTTREISPCKIINVILYSIVLVMPFIVTRNYYSPYLGAKLLFMYIAGTILLFAAVLTKNEMMKMYKEKIIVLCYFASLVFTTIFSIDIDTAIIGKQDRGEGLIILGIYFLSFLMSAKYLKITKKMIKAVLIVSCIMGIYCILQFYGFDIFLSILNKKIISFGSIALIGNKNFASTYILIFLSLSVPLYIFKGEKIYYVCSLILFGALLCTTTRGCWIAFAIMCVVGLFFVIKRKELWIRTGIVIFSLGIVFTMLNQTSNGKLSSRFRSIGQEISQVDEKGVGSLGTNRVAIWIITMKSIEKHPFMGAGLDSLQYRINRDEFEEHRIFIKKYNEIIDKAHNEFIELWACGGIVSLICYIVLIVVILKELIRAMKKHNDDKYKIMFLFFITYLMQSFVNISMVACASIYWIMLGAIVQQYRLAKEEEPDNVNAMSL